MQTNLTIALAQVEIATDPAVNLGKAERFTRQAASQGADIIVFPEMFMGQPTPDRPPKTMCPGARRRATRLSHPRS